MMSPMMMSPVRSPSRSPAPSNRREERKEDAALNSGIEVALKQADGSEVVVFWTTIVTTVALLMSLVWLLLRNLDEFRIK